MRKTRATAAEKNAIHDRRVQLQRRLVGFNNVLDTISMNALLRDDQSDDDDQDQDGGAPDARSSAVWDTDSESDSDLEDSDENDEDEEPRPEKQVIRLPSNMSEHDRLRLGIANLAEQEVELRKVQINEALSQIRLVLGHKAVIYRKLRQTEGQAAKSRTRKEADTLDQRVKRHAQHYRTARLALVRLGLNGTQMQAYPEICKEDLKMSADIVEENRFGQHNDALAWFWRVQRGEDEVDGPWMNECGCLSP